MLRNEAVRNHEIKVFHLLKGVFAFERGQNLYKMTFESPGMKPTMPSKRRLFGVSFLAVALSNVCMIAVVRYGGYFQAADTDFDILEMNRLRQDNAEKGALIALFTQRLKNCHGGVGGVPLPQQHHKVESPSKGDPSRHRVFYQTGVTIIDKDKEVLVGLQDKEANKEECVGKCGADHNNCSCIDPDEAFCNEDSGFCGNTALHRQASIGSSFNYDHSQD